MGALTATPSRNAPKGPVASATTSEWKAVATPSRLKRIFASPSFTSAASMASVGPLSTICFGPLWFASTRPGIAHASTFARTSSAGAETAVIAPGFAATAAIRSPRSRATRIASSSLSTPAAWSAITSPKLCPPTDAGVTPSRSISRSSERLATPMAGCAHCVSVSRACQRASASGANSGFGKTTSWSGASSKTPSRLAARSHGSRASSQVMATLAPMSTYWLPWPGKRKATSSAAPEPKATPSGVTKGSPAPTFAAAFASFASRSAASFATIASRAPFAA